MDELLKLVDMNHQLACDIETGGCGYQNYIHHLLLSAPHVFTTGNRPFYLKEWAHGSNYYWCG